MRILHWRRNGNALQRKICNVYCQHSKRTDQTVVDKEERLLINKNLDIVVPFFYAEDPKDVVNAVRAGTHKYEPIVPIDRKKVIVDVFPIQTRWDKLVPLFWWVRYSIKEKF